MGTPTLGTLRPVHAFAADASSAPDSCSACSTLAARSASACDTSSCEVGSNQFQPPALGLAARRGRRRACRCRPLVLAAILGSTSASLAGGLQVIAGRM